MHNQSVEISLLPVDETHQTVLINGVKVAGICFFDGEWRNMLSDVGHSDPMDTARDLFAQIRASQKVIERIFEGDRNV